ncbi:hypothetical protein KKE54_02030 [bacterium]|nr:hypothetical protein [bacterium]
MQIEYVGPKVLISSRGISFDRKKRDKYIYLNSLLQLMQAIDREYVEDKIYTYTTARRQLGSRAIIDALRPYCHDIEALMAKAQYEGESYVEATLARARGSIVLNAEEIRALVNNINLMRDYNIQRHINKSLFYGVVQMFIDRMKQSRIAYMSAPMNTRYFHVFNTVQRCFYQQKSPVNSELAFHVEEGGLYVKLQVINF